jgi:hypothetical protein
MLKSSDLSVLRMPYSGSFSVGTFCKSRNTAFERHSSADRLFDNYDYNTGIAFYLIV